jgi:hypothetical protein
LSAVPGTFTPRSEKEGMGSASCRPVGTQSHSDETASASSL